MIIYIDDNYKCHTENDGAMRAFDIPYFDGKCKTYIEGFVYVPQGETATINGVKCIGEMRAPCRDLALLDEFQAQYEAQQAETEQLKADLADADAALKELGVEV